MTEAQQDALLLQHATFINSLITKAKLPSELSNQSDITDSSEVSILQKGTDDAKRVATGLLRGFRGTWAASTNTPTLVDGTGIDLDILIVTVAGNQNLGNGSQSFKIGDRVEFINGIWYKRNGGDFELSLNTGVLTGGQITVNGGDPAKFDVASGTGYILDWTTPSAPKGTEISWGEFLAQDIPNISGELFTTVSIIESATPKIGELLIRSGVITTPQRRRQEIILQGFTHTDGTTITAIGLGQKPAYEVVEALLDYVMDLGAQNKGNQIVSNGANLKIDKTTGSTTLPFINKLNDPQNPTTLTNISQIEASHSTFYQDGSGDFIQTGGVTDVDPDFWDDGSGTLVAVGNPNPFTIKRFYFFGQAETVAVSYGQAEYGSLADAKANIILEQPVVSPIFQLGVFTTALIIRKGVTDLDAAILAGDAEFVEISGFTSSGGGGSVGNFITQDTDQLTGNTGDKTWGGTHIFDKEIESNGSNKYGFGGDVAFIAFRKPRVLATDEYIIDFLGASQIEGQGNLGSPGVSGISIYTETAKYNFTTDDQIPYGIFWLRRDNLALVSLVAKHKDEAASSISSRLHIGYNNFPNNFADQSNKNILDINGNIRADNYTLDEQVGEAVAIGDLVYLKSDGKWWLSNADSEVTSSTELAVVTEVAVADDIISIIRTGSVTGLSGLTTGDKYYLDDASGDITNDTNSFSSGSIVRYIGTAKSTTVLYFNPSQTYIKLL